MRNVVLKLDMMFNLFLGDDIGDVFNFRIGNNYDNVNVIIFNFGLNYIVFNFWFDIFNIFNFSFNNLIMYLSSIVILSININ